MASDAREKLPFFYEKNVEHKITYAKVVGRVLEFLTISMVPSHYLSGVLFPFLFAFRFSGTRKVTDEPRRQMVCAL